MGHIAYAKNMKRTKFEALNLVSATALAMVVFSPKAVAQNIAWVPATVITGDSNLATNGVYFDAFIPLLPSSLSADGITFNAPTTTDSDGTISYVITSGSDNRYDNNALFTGGSSAFNAIMNAGGTYQNGDTGAATVTIGGLTLGHTYQVQIFDYAGDGDTGYTTFSGSTPVTLNTIGSGAEGGSFTTGTFTATAATELFNWNGCCGSSYTVLGAIAVFDLSAVPPPASTIVWGPAMGITGDSNLVTNGIHLDALLSNTGAGSSLTADGVTFNKVTSNSSSGGSDGIISFAVTSGNNNTYAFDEFATAPPSSPAFAAIMDSGGTFENGGAGAGSVTISHLTAGHVYSVQVFNYANDNDQGLTTLSGATPVTIGNLPGLAGPNTYGEFATGTFTATGASETFKWNGAGSSYTVLGPISVVDITVLVTISPASIINQGDTAIFSASVQLAQTLSYQWQTDSGSSGANWSAISGATNANFVLNTGTLAVGDDEFKVVLTYGATAITSAPVTLEVIVPSAPLVVKDTTPNPASQYVGQSVTFYSTFNGNHPITNQWQVSEDAGNTFQDIAGATNTAFTLNNLQITNSGEYRLVAGNAIGSNHSSSATLTVKPWSDALIQWSAVVPFQDKTAGQILTNVSGSYLGAASFFFGSFLQVTAGNKQFTFRSDGAAASITGGSVGYSASATGYGNGAFGTNTTGDANFDAVLNQFYNNGAVNLITLNNLVVGQTYGVQLFALDNRGGTTNELADFANPSDPADVSAAFSMGSNAYVIGTFTASNTSQTIQENLLTGGAGNINAVVVRALSYTPSVAPLILKQPRSGTFLQNHTATFTVVADAAPAPAYQWKEGPVGGPYTNLSDSAKYSGTLTPSLAVSNVQPGDAMEFIATVTNSSFGVVSAPADLYVWTPSDAASVIVACIGASDVSTPTPYGTPNWPVYIAPMLGDGYTVDDFGASGTDMITNGDSPYWDTSQYPESTDSSADVVIIMLGSNDSKPENWAYQTNYVPDYERMIAHYRDLPTHPRIYLNTLLTAYGAGNYGITDPIVTGIITPWIKQIGFDEGCPVIDINAATKNMPQNFPDNIHPDIAGAQVVAATVFYGLMRYGETPPVFPQLACALDGDQIQLSWPPDHIGWRLETQTNGLRTNWGTVSGSSATNRISLPLNATGGDIFFRLSYP